MVVATFSICCWCGRPNISPVSLESWKYRLNALGFCRDIVDAYYPFTESLPSTTLFTGSRTLHHLANNLQIDSINHWIAEGSRQRCSLPECKGTSLVVYGLCWDQISKKNPTPSFHNTPLKKNKDLEKRYTWKQLTHFSLISSDPDP